YALYGIFNSIRYSFSGAEIYPHPAEMVALVGGKEAENFYKQQKELSEVDDAIERMKTERGVAARNKKAKEMEAAKASTNADNKEARKEAKPARNNESNDRASGPTNMDVAPAATDLLSEDFDRDTKNNAMAQASKRLPDEVEAESVRVRLRQFELHAR